MVEKVENKKETGQHITRAQSMSAGDIGGSTYRRLNVGASKFPVRAL